MMRVLLLALGGALGTLARYGVAVGTARIVGTGLPWATLLVNALGCLLLGALSEVVGRGQLSPDLRLALGTGFCGGFTTYSTFNQEALLLWKNGAPGTAALYLAGTLVVCGVMGLLGMASARWALA